MKRESGVEMTTDIDRASIFLAALANAKRLMILELLIQQELPVGQLAKMVDLSQSALSQHLGKLRAAGLVTTRRDAQTVYYSCHVTVVSSMLSLISSHYPSREPHIANLPVLSQPEI
ncbi:MAG: ArsR/SmtB family transcription factor [Allorhizobium sp.]